MSELKACPFCGKEMQKYDLCGDENTIWCGNCGGIGPNDLTQELAAKMWNLRRPEDALQKRAEAAEAKVAELEAAARWVPVEEGYPVEDETYYDVVIRYVFKKPFVDVAIWQAGVFYTMRSEDWNDKDHEYITHYRPRPQPPQEVLK